MSDQFIVINKQPGVRPVGVGETWRRLFPMILLKVTGPEVTMVCQEPTVFQTEGGKYQRDPWSPSSMVKNLSTEEWVFILVDAKNAFNEIN